MIVKWSAARGPRTIVAMAGCSSLSSGSDVCPRCPVSWYPELRECPYHSVRLRPSLWQEGRPHICVGEPYLDIPPSSEGCTPPTWMWYCGVTRSGKRSRPQRPGGQNAQHHPPYGL